MINSQSEQFAVSFSAPELDCLYAASATAGKNVIYLPLLPCKEMPTQFFAARWPTAQTEVHPELLADCGGTLHTLWRACARLSGGHPQSARVIIDLLRPSGDDGPRVRSWAQILQGVTQVVGQQRGGATDFTDEDVLRVFSPCYRESLGSEKVRCWVTAGVLNADALDEHVLPLPMLLPFAYSSENGVLTKRLRTVFDDLVDRRDRGAIRLFHKTLFHLLPLVRRQEVRDALQENTDWSACALVEGLCANAGRYRHDAVRRDTLKENLQTRRYDFTQDRTVRTYKPGGLAGKTAEELNRHVWLPKVSLDACSAAFLFLREAGADAGAGGLTPVALLYDFTGKMPL
jgi:hypothetical protein